MSEQNRITSGVASTFQFHSGRHPKIEAMLSEGVKLKVAEHIYNLRTSTGLTQSEFAQLIGVEPAVIDELEEWDYEGDTLAMLAHIEKSLRRHVEAHIVPAHRLYPDVLLAATITGLKLTLFRHHPGRKGLEKTNGNLNIPIKTRDDILHLRNELEPWQHALHRNRQELQIFALAGMTEWCHLDDDVRANFTGNPSEFMKAAETHNHLIAACMHYIETGGERTAIKKWRQEMDVQEEARYLAELEFALQHKTFEEFPDTEWLVQTLIGFVKSD